MSDETRRDLDEIRRLAFMAKIALRASRPLGNDLVGTLMHAVAYHVDEMPNPGWCAELGKHLLHGDHDVEKHLDQIIEKAIELLGDEG